MFELLKEMNCSSFILTRKFVTIVSVILVISLVMVLHRTHFENSLEEPRPWAMTSSHFPCKDQHENEGTKKDGDENDNWKQNQIKRIKTFREQCQMYELNTNSRVNKDSLEKVLYSEKYKLAYKPIPKVGSTFLKQVIFLLSGIKTDHLFDLARNDIHKIKSPKIQKPMTVENLKGYTILIITRNPYSRIYSAYIDKIYILNSLSLCEAIYSKVFVSNNRIRSCYFNISFEDFLDYILHTDIPVLRDHYEPIMSQSYGKHVCNFEDIQIVKQETFSEDIDHALKSVNVRGKVYDVIYDEMHSKHTESTIASIVKTVYNKFYSNIQNKSCLSWKDMSLKLWKSFQIQGYIHKNSKFPDKRFDSKSDYWNLIELIMDELEKRPLKHEEKESQRNTALLKAYASVDKKYIREIRERYAMDFDMFQYNTDIFL